MVRWVGRLRVFLILLLLLVAVIAPVVVSGYADLSRAGEFKRTGQAALAADYYQLAARKLPWKEELWSLAASSYALGGSCKDAMPLFELGKRQGTLSADSWILYGVCYELDGRYQAARAVWSDGLKQYPDEAVFYAYFAAEEQRRNDFAAEAHDLAIWVASGQAKAVSHYRLGELLMALNPDQARAQFHQAVSMDKAFDSAVLTLNASLDLAAQESDPSPQLVILGRGLGLVSEWPLAQYDFQQAVNADPKNAEAWAWLGEAQQENKLDGKPALDRALELDASNPLVHGLRGLYWRRNARYAAALAEYQAAAKLEPKNAEWQAALGDTYTSSGDLVSALAAYQAATSLAPTNATYWRLLALFSADNGVQVFDIGLPAAKKAAGIAPNDPQVLDTLGWTYAQAGLLNTAEQTLIKALKAAPDFALAHLHLGEVYLKQGRPSLASHELSLAHQLDPAGPAGAYAAQLLKQYFP